MGSVLSWGRSGGGVSVPFFSPRPMIRCLSAVALGARTALVSHLVGHPGQARQTVIIVQNALISCHTHTQDPSLLLGTGTFQNSREFWDSWRRSKSPHCCPNPGQGYHRGADRQWGNQHTKAPWVVGSKQVLSQNTRNISEGLDGCDRGCRKLLKILKTFVFSQKA